MGIMMTIIGVQVPYSNYADPWKQVGLAQGLQYQTNQNSRLAADLLPLVKLQQLPDAIEYCYQYNASVYEALLNQDAGAIDTKHFRPLSEVHNYHCNYCFHAIHRFFCSEIEVFIDLEGVVRREQAFCSAALSHLEER